MNENIFRKDSEEKTLTEAKERIQKLINGPIKSIGLELEFSPAHLHSKAVSAGFQEYVEARTLLSLMAEKRIITYPEVQKEFEFNITDDDYQRPVVTMISEMDYMLGLADLSGELMRKAINSISSGDSDDCFQACDIVRHLYTGYLGKLTQWILLSGLLDLCRLSILSNITISAYKHKRLIFQLLGHRPLLYEGDWDCNLPHRPCMGS